MRCVLCGGHHDRRDKYGALVMCAQCLADLRHERLSRIAPAVMQSESKHPKPATPERGEKTR
jgi:hypothetical protein